MNYEFVIVVVMDVVDDNVVIEDGIDVYIDMEKEFETKDTNHNPSEPFVADEESGAPKKSPRSLRVNKQPFC